MDIYCKNCRKRTQYTHPKKLVLISDKKIKTKSECPECLADKIYDEYDLEQLVKHVFLLMYFIKEHVDFLRKGQEKN